MNNIVSDEILMMVDKPARYIGKEVNSIVKAKADVDIRFCMCFPDVYEVGMSHLGIQILYDMFIRLGRIWTNLCGKNRFRYLRWNLRIL